MSVDPHYKVLVVGHSYVYWLRSFVETTLPGPGFSDFAVDGVPCDVNFNGVRGATVNMFLDADMFAHELSLFVLTSCASVWEGMIYLPRHPLWSHSTLFG